MTIQKQTGFTAGLALLCAGLLLFVGDALPVRAQGQGQGQGQRQNGGRGQGSQGGHGQGQGGDHHIQFQVGKVTKKADQPHGGHGH